MLHRMLPAAFLLFGFLWGGIIPRAQTVVSQATETASCGPRVRVEYTDDDPDYFIITNRSPEGWHLVSLAIDLAPSAGALMFDTDEGGLGVGGASPFFPDDASPVRLVRTVPAQDGGQTIALHFENFVPNSNYSFYVDVDAAPNGEGRTWVLPSDIRGARVSAAFRGPSGQTDIVDARFAEIGEADSGAGGCV